MSSPADRRRAASIALLLALVVLSAGAMRGQAPTPAVPSPQAFFGFRMGATGQLADWPDIQRYFSTVAAASDRVELAEIGTSTEGRHLVAAIVSAPDNLRRLEGIRQVNQRLADPRGLGDVEASRLSANQPLVVVIGASIHAPEAGATQMANELLHQLATDNDPRTLDILDRLVVVLIPSLNPDGHAAVADWVRRTRGTRYEGARMPWLSHKYAGHDINRDAFMMNLAESRALAGFFYARWHPQVFLAMHEMGPRGPRMFVPPNAEPIHPNSDPLIWREAALLGGAMALELERNDRAGVISNAMFDYYSPGYEDSAPLGHNTVGLLSEVASANLAWPLTIAPKELGAAPGGSFASTPRVTFPNPWPGGTWSPRDIVEYELDAARGLLAAAALHRPQLLDGFYRMGRRAVERGRAGSPSAFIIPPEQEDPYAAARLITLLVQGGVEVQQAQEPFRVGDAAYPAGTHLVLMAQPHRAYAKTLLEKQEYPRIDSARRAPSHGTDGATGKAGPAERPYDVAGWTLPWQTGVRVDRVEPTFELPVLSSVDRGRIPPGQVLGERRPDLYLVDAPGTGGTLALNRLLAARLEPAWLGSSLDFNGHHYPAGSLGVRASRRARDTVTTIARDLGLRADGIKGRRPAAAGATLAWARVGLHRPWLANADEGWNRYLLDQFGIPYRSLPDAEIRKGGLRATFDVVVLPDALPRDLLGGPRAGSLPPEYLGGLGDEGLAALVAFVRAGGSLVCLGSSGALAIDALDLPVTDVVSGLAARDFSCPGSILRLSVDTTHPLGFGVPADAPAFFSDGAVYQVDPATPGAAGVRIVARYADRDVLMSGWLEGEARLAGKGAVLEVPFGKGRIILFGIRPQHRAQTMVTFRLLFNALVRAGAAGK